jgi:deoxyribonuclease-4
MILGAHESVAGGLHLAFERCRRDRAEALQLWTRSSRQWASTPLAPEAVARFKDAHAESARIPTSAHAAYLINLAAPNAAIYERSIDTLTEECLRADALSVDNVVVHPGASQWLGTASGLERAASALVRVCDGLRGKKVRLLLEFTAGQGTSIGCSFAELDALLQGAGDARLGICLDTQHLYAAGVDWTTPRGYARTFEDFDRVIGLRHLLAFHLNDSKRPLGARVDRHEVIGRGHIGLAPFGRLVRDPRFATLPGYLETPPLREGVESYKLGLRRLRSLL